MVSTAYAVKFKVLDSELEALLTEAELIRTYQPHFNILLKDDKSPLYIHITDEEFPRVIAIRKKEIISAKPKGTILGPFPSAYKTQEVLKIARKIFPWCNGGSRPCFYYHIDLCPGSCINEITQTKYNKNIKQLILFLKGKKQTVSKNLKKMMDKNIILEKYEEAAIIRDQLKMIDEVTKKSHRLKPELTTQALKNKINEDGIIYLQKILSTYLSLPKKLPLKRIEGYDVSNTQGTNSAVSMVVFTDGKPDSSQYRLFNIKTLNTPNDYHMMKEAIIRRQNHPEWSAPNLVVVDGGKGQVRTILQIWNWQNPIIGIAKNPDRFILPIINWTRWEDKNNKKEILKGLQYHIVKLDANDPSLKLVQQIRNEAHRFSQNQHKKRRIKGMFS